MGYFIDKHYFTGTSGTSLKHSANKTHAKYGTKNSTSDEKGTDNKKNNTSEYNAEYYQENKEKWEDNESSSSSKTSSKKSSSSSKSDNDDLFYDKDGKARFGHKDYDENDEDFKRTDGEKIEGTDLRSFTNKNGSTIIVGNGIKFSFPPGTKITSAMARKLANIENNYDGKDKEKYVAQMLNAVTGFADRQNLFSEKKSTKSSSGSKKSTETKEEKSSSSSSSSGKRDWSKIKTDYYSGKKSDSSTPTPTKEELKSGVTSAKKKKTTKQNSQFKKK